MPPAGASGDFTGRVAIVTGAARGLGRAAAARLHERGAFVAVNVRDATRAADVARRIGPRALGVPADVATDEGPESIAKQTLDRFGRIDILINNAALPLTTRFEQISAAEWRQALEVNLTAPFRLIQAVLPAMKAQRYGRIVNISSTAGRMVSTLGGAHYTTSKTGLLGLTRAAAKELGQHGITVNAVCPGMIGSSHNSTLICAADAVALVGTLWVNAIRMTVIPLVVSLLITGVASASDISTIGRIGSRTIAVFIAMAAAGA